MNIRIFNREYTVRRFGPQENYKGHLYSPYEDFTASLHLHPTGSDQMQANPEGQRRMKHIEGHSDVELIVANETRNQRGDWVYYRGEWYECTSAMPYDHTLLSHYNYVFVLVPLDAQSNPELAAPPVSGCQCHNRQGGGRL